MADLDRMDVIAKELDALKRAKEQDDWTVYQDAIAKLELGAIEKIEFLVGEVAARKVEYGVLLEELFERTRERNALKRALDAAEIRKEMGL